VNTLKLPIQRELDFDRLGYGATARKGDEKTAREDEG
jgi:hypothetical protein